MRILVDTHAVLWYQANDPKLTHAYREIMENSTNHCYVSIVSLWEIALKSSIGKLPLNMLLRAFFATIERAGFTTQTLNPYHLLLSAELPMHHRDPFDRMLIAQAKVEGMQILTADPHFARYDVPLIRV
jgi:PIN domain nuclease of toxin-antitoxin system